jgi:IS4 transposase
VQPKLYHLGIRSSISHSNLAHANNTRDWRIYADFAQLLIQWAKQLYLGDDFGLDLDATVYALDATTIDLCLSLFPWAKFRRVKGAVKLHTLLNLQGDIPEFILISDGKMHDVNVLDHLLPVPGAYYVMDRGYLDFERLYVLHQAKSYFVTRSKRNFNFKRRYSHEVDKTTGVQCDQTIVLKTYYSSQGYPEPLRRIRYYDADRDKRLTFLTNDFTLPATTIAALYKSRWRIELFFKWIKQHLRIKSFYGTSENAVKTQIWIAVATYLLVAIIKKELGIKLPLYTILQILSLIQFEKTPVFEVLSDDRYKIQLPTFPNQLLLFD